MRPVFAVQLPQRDVIVRMPVNVVTTPSRCSQTFTSPRAIRSNSPFAYGDCGASRGAADFRAVICACFLLIHAAFDFTNRSISTPDSRNGARTSTAPSANMCIASVLRRERVMVKFMLRSKIPLISSTAAIANRPCRPYPARRPRSSWAARRKTLRPARLF